MADAPGEDKTEQPTQRRLEKAREEGAVVRAHGLPAAAGLLAGAMAFALGGGTMIELLQRSLRAGLSLDPAAMREPSLIFTGAWQVLSPGIHIVLAFFALMTVIAVFANTAVGGWIFSTQPLAADFSRLDPMRGLGRLFSRDGLMETVRSLAKLLVVGGGAFWLLENFDDAFLGLAREAWPDGVRHMAALHIRIFLILSAAVAGVVALEVPYQLWAHRGRLRMTRQEVRDEQKELEGSPHTKRRIRTLRRKLARMRMMSEVPKADAVVVNPQHYAAALRYREGKMRAPRVVAKGAGLVALRIRTLAAEHDVPIIEAPPLARSICKFVELEDEIPAGLYQAVAEVLAYVYRLKAARDGGKPAPAQPKDGRFDPPDEYRS